MELNIIEDYYEDSADADIQIIFEPFFYSTVGLFQIKFTKNLKTLRFKIR